MRNEGNYILISDVKSLIRNNLGGRSQRKNSEFQALYGMDKKHNSLKKCEDFHRTTVFHEDIPKVFVLENKVN